MRKPFLVTPRFNSFWDKEQRDLVDGTTLWAALASWDYCTKEMQKEIDYKNKRIAELECKLKQIGAFAE